MEELPAKVQKLEGAQERFERDLDIVKQAMSKPRSFRFELTGWPAGVAVSVLAVGVASGLWALFS